MVQAAPQKTVNNNLPAFLKGWLKKKQSSTYVQQDIRYVLRTGPVDWYIEYWASVTDQPY
jgi:hypothetical protein